jgi:integrase
LTRQEVRSILGLLNGPEWIMAMLLYGAGLRLMECLRLRVKDIDFASNELRIRSEKGNKDRVTMLPSSKHRVVFVLHCQREGRTRIIGARKATRKERKQYEKGIYE